MMEDIFVKLNKIEVRTGSERQIKSYVLRNNTLEESQKEIIREYGDRYLLFFDENRRIDVEKVYGNNKPLIIEIGFGMGEGTVSIAKNRNGYNYLALDVYLSGVVKLLKNVGTENLENVRIMRFNAPDVLEHMIEDGSVEGFHIFFPDPWPKKRHHKRRLIQKPLVDLLAKKLKRGGYVYLATDWKEYADWMLEILSSSVELENPYDDFADPVSWRPMTKFEQKGLDKDYKISELWFVKK